jgi:prefoldin subunit 5
MTVKKKMFFFILLIIFLFVVAFRASMKTNIETFLENTYAVDTSTALNFFNDKNAKTETDSPKGTDCSINPNIIECQNKQHAFSYDVYNRDVQNKTRTLDEVSKANNVAKVPKVPKERVCPPQITFDDLEYEYVTEDERVLEERKEEIEGEINELQEQLKELKNDMDESRKDFEDQVRMQENVQRDISQNTAREASGSVRKAVDDQVSPLSKTMQTISEKVEAMQKDFNKLKDLPGEFGPLKDGIKDIRDRVASFIGQR